MLMRPRRHPRPVLRGYSEHGGAAGGCEGAPDESQHSTSCSKTRRRTLRWNSCTQNRLGAPNFCPALTTPTPLLFRSHCHTHILSLSLSFFFLCLSLLERAPTPGTPVSGWRHAVPPP